MKWTGNPHGRRICLCRRWRDANWRRALKRVSVWTGVVIRGDNDSVSVGRSDECSREHGNPRRPRLSSHHRGARNDRPSSHDSRVHAGRGVLVGIQAIVLNGAVIGKNSLVGAGAVVTENKVFPENSLILGSPAKVVREVGRDVAVQSDNADYVEHVTKHATKKTIEESTKRQASISRVAAARRCTPEPTPKTTAQNGAPMFKMGWSATVAR